MITSPLEPTPSSRQSEILQEKGQPTSLRPARKIVRATIWHPAPLAVCVDVVIDNLCVGFGRVESHEWVKYSELQYTISRTPFRPKFLRSLPCRSYIPSHQRQLRKPSK